MQDIPKLGQLCDENSRRDAVHIAVAPVTAFERLKSGDPVELNKIGQAVWSDYDSAIGIVDPFLRKEVMPGETFWLYLKPGTVTGMRHVFSHPAFQPRLPNKE